MTKHHKHVKTAQHNPATSARRMQMARMYAWMHARIYLCMYVYVCVYVNLARMYASIYISSMHIEIIYKNMSECTLS